MSFANNAQATKLLKLLLQNVGDVAFILFVMLWHSFL